MIRDRGLKKWNAALLLPEHVKSHRNWQKEMNYSKMPVLDEHRFEEMDRLIHEAMEYTLPVNITYFIKKQKHTISGHFHLYEPVKGEIRLVTLEGTPLTVKLTAIINMELYLGGI